MSSTLFSHSPPHPSGRRIVSIWLCSTELLLVILQDILILCAEVEGSAGTFCVKRGGM